MAGNCCFWEMNFLLEIGRKDDKVEKVSNKKTNTSSCKVSLQEVAKMCGMTPLSCHEHHTNEFIQGIEMSHISQRIPNGVAYNLGPCKRVLSTW